MPEARTGGDSSHVVKERFFRPTRKDRPLHIYPRFIDFHRLRMEGDYEYPLHQHSNYEVILVARGPYRCRLNSEELELEDHQVLVIKPGDWHQDHLRRGQFHFVLHFSIQTSRVRGVSGFELFGHEAREAMQVCRGRFQAETRFLEEIEVEAEKQGPYSPTIQDALLEAFFWRMVRALPEEGLSSQFKQLSSDQRFVDMLQEAIAESLYRSMTVGDLAASLGMSRRTLNQKCRNLLGSTPANALMTAKVDKAHELLEYTDMPVKEISFRLGFKNPYHFSKVFKRFAGASPSGVRGCGQIPMTNGDE